MTATKQEVEKQKPDTSSSGTKQQAAAASRNRKPAVPKVQAKTTSAKSTGKTSAFPSRSGESVSALKANATRAEALEHENVAVQNKRATEFNTDTTDVSGVIVPTVTVEIKESEPATRSASGKEDKPVHKKEARKDSSKDKKAQLTHQDAAVKHETPGDNVDQQKRLETLQQKALKSEKKVKKLKKKVHKAEKKQAKTSKIRALKEKLTKAFAKWQRRKKRVEETKA